MAIELQIDKTNVMSEVAKVTSYVASKMMPQDAQAYDRLFTTSEDSEMLERFWREACDMLLGVVKPFFVEQKMINAQYCINLDMPELFPVALVPSIESDLFSFCTYYIVAHWFAYVNGADGAIYETKAAEAARDASKKLYHRVKPVRVDPYE